MKKVECYFNSHKKLVSVRKRGKVIAHAAGVVLKNPDFVVQEGGRQRVIREERKNVHAYVRGKLITELDDQLCQDLYGMMDDAGYRRARYSPYEKPFFYDAITKSAIYTASYAIICGSKLIYK